jgi:protein-disulfide isomerase
MSEQGAMSGELALAVSEEDHIRGDPAAPLTLVLYGDFECTDTGAANREVRELEERLGERLRFVFRNFPLTEIHRHALDAAEAAEAAAAQGRYWAMYDLLFENQRHLHAEHLHEYAGQVGLDVERFDADVAEHEHLDRIEEDAMSGERSGVGGAPAFFVGGLRHEGAYDVETLEAALERST